MLNHTVASLWRYPVKSMAGEELDVVEMTERGLAGDRAYALVDTNSSKVGSAKNVKRFGNLLKCDVRFTAPPQSDAPLPPVRITWPDCVTTRSDDPEIEAVLAKSFGDGVTLMSTAPDGLILEFAAGTLGGKFSETTQLPVSSGAPKGTLFNYAAVHLVTTSTLRELAAAHPEGQASLPRFRPNIVVDSADAKGFPENDWIGKTVAIGPEVLLRVSIPCPRCVVTTLPRTDLPLDSSMLRTIAQANTVDMGDFGNLPCVGIYADVVRAGRVRRGDLIRVLS
jgi:MOSC domain-containing protein